MNAHKHGAEMETDMEVEKNNKTDFEERPDRSKTNRARDDFEDRRRFQRKIARKIYKKELLKKQLLKKQRQKLLLKQWLELKRRREKMFAESAELRWENYERFLRERIDCRVEEKQQECERIIKAAKAASAYEKNFRIEEEERHYMKRSRENNG